MRHLGIFFLCLLLGSWTYAQDAYHQALQGELQTNYGISGGNWLFSQTEMANLNNAIKYGGNPPIMEVRVHKEGKETQIAIRDFGMGIPRIYHDQVFEKFFRVPQGNRHDQPGSGLGLAYVKAVMARHGGSVGMESHPGQGTTFFLQLPSPGHP